MLMDPTVTKMTSVALARLILRLVGKSMGKWLLTNATLSFTSRNPQTGKMHV